MPRESQLYIKTPWTGGVNSSLDPGVLPDNDLVLSDNVIKAVSGSRLKREGINYFDLLTIPSVTAVSHSTTTVTLTFASDIVSGSNKIFVVGERITVVTSDSQYNVTDSAITAIPANNQLSYTVSVSPTASTATISSITRTATIVALHDFWYYDANNNSRQQLLISANSHAQVFKYDSNGNRIQITNKTYSVTLTDVGDKVTYNSHGFVEGDALYFTSITSTTGVSINVVYYVAGTITTNDFQLAATKGGAALALTTNGSGVMASPQFSTTSITSADMLTINERCVITFDGLNNFPKVIEPLVSTTEMRPLKGAPPNGKFMRLHQGRIFMNSKEEPDRVYYSSPFNQDEWSGYGDSGVLNIFYGDGDPDGILSIDPPFKGSLFLKKRSRTYRVDGDSPENYSISLVTSGLGGASHKSVAQVDLDDVMYVSYKGIHSLQATSSYGDFSGAFLSDKIQPTFKEFTFDRLGYSAAQYVPSLNSIFFSFSSGEFSQNKNDVLYVFNTKLKEWDRWPEVEAACLCLRSNSSREQLLFGGYEGRISKCQIGSYADYTSTPIEFKIKTGTIYVDNNPITIKGFKRLGFLFKPKGQFTFTVKVKIDNNSIQTLSFSQTTNGKKLGDTFVLGTSVLAFDSVLAPYMLPIDGYGRGLSIQIEQNGLEEQIEIYGIIIEWVPADMAQETVTNPAGG